MLIDGSFRYDLVERQHCVCVFECSKKDEKFSEQLVNTLVNTCWPFVLWRIKAKLCKVVREFVACIGQSFPNRFNIWDYCTLFLQKVRYLSVHWRSQNDLKSQKFVWKQRMQCKTLSIPDLALILKDCDCTDSLWKGNIWGLRAKIDK